MKKLCVFLIVCFLSFSTIITGFGYANLSHSMTVMGTAHSKIQDGVFISDVTLKSETNATEKVGGYAQCVLNTALTFGDSSDASVSYTVEFFNNTEVDMAYVNIVFDENAYDNRSLKFAASDIVDGAIIAPGNKLSLTLTISEKSDSLQSGELFAVIGFQFAEVVIFDERPGHFEPGENYNQLVRNILSNSNGYGLNDSHKGHVIHNELEENRILYSVDNIQGGNINKVLNALQSATANIDFMFEYVSDIEYIVYFIDKDEAIVGKDATVYKQFFHYNGTVWESGAAFLGHGKIKEISRDKGTVNFIAPSEWIIGPTPQSNQ